MYLKKLISIGLSPNIRWPDVYLAARLLFQPWKWHEQIALEELHRRFSDLLVVKRERVFPVISGRAGIFAALKAYDIGEGDEVIVQGFTCVAVTNAIQWVGAKPVFADIKRETLNMNMSDLEKKISDKTRAVIIQHTFGLPFSEWEKLSRLSEDHNFVIIEDCAHALGAKVKDRPVGTLGHLAVFSFGRDKVISSVFGGMVVVNDPNEVIVEEVQKYTRRLLTVPRVWIFKQLLHPIITWKAIKFYPFGVGKLIHHLALLLGIISRATSLQEKACGPQPKWLESQYPGVLAKLAIRQLADLQTMNNNRDLIAKRYKEAGIKCLQKDVVENVERVWLRYPIEVEIPEKMRAYFSKRNIFLGDWYDQVVGPKEVELGKTGYGKGDTPTAEDISKHIVNLPLNPWLNDGDIDRIIKVYKEWKEYNRKSVEIGWEWLFT